MNPTYHIKTEEVIDPAEVILLMNAGGNYFSFALMRKQSKEIVEFGYYSIPNGQEESWSAFFENKNFLTEKYPHSAISLNLTESMLIPAAYSHAGQFQSKLDLVFGQNFHTVTFIEDLPEWEMTHITRVDESLHTVVKKHFPSAHMWSTNSVLLKNVNSEYHNSILVDFRTDEFSVLVFSTGRLQLLRSFSYSSPEDVLYYLLKICSQTGLTQQDVNIILAGLIEKNSAIFRELYKYFIHLEFEDLPAEISIAEALYECPRHYFSSICKLATCVL